MRPCELRLHSEGLEWETASWIARRTTTSWWVCFPRNIRGEVVSGAFESGPVARPAPLGERHRHRHGACDRLPVGSIVVNALLGTMIMSHLAPINRSNILAVCFRIHSERLAPGAAAELHALDEPLTKFLFGHGNRVSRTLGSARRNTLITRRMPQTKKGPCCRHDPSLDFAKLRGLREKK